jgi:hypothetical protein
VLRADVALAVAVHVTHGEIVERARKAFAEDAASVPPMSLRSGDDADSYRVPRAYDPDVDSPTQVLIGQLAFWAIPHLDAGSWRHHLPHLIEYGLAHRSDPGDLAVEAILWSLRPPDRDPPRLGSLSDEQEAVVVAFLDVLALDDASEHKDLATQVIEEWWGPRPLFRPRKPDA